MVFSPSITRPLMSAVSCLSLRARLLCECLWHDRRKVWHMQTLKSPLAPPYKQRESFYPGEFMDGEAGWRRLADVSSWDKTLRDCTDPARVQTRADTSLNIQTKHGCIIRAITQQSSQGTHCEPVSFIERAQPTHLLRPALNCLDMVPLSL